MRGGEFLVAAQSPVGQTSDDVFTPEDLSGEHLAIVRTAQDFWTNEVAPNLENMRRKEPGVL